MNRKVVYTAIFGNKDTLKDPLHTDVDCDYVCFTDSESLKSDVWKVVKVDPIDEDPVRSAKIYKVNPHLFLSEYNTSMWIDANFLVCSSLSSFFQILGPQANMLTFQHDQGRNCIYDEAEIIISHQKDDPAKVREQMNKYKKDNYPKDLGLTANSVLLRRHNEEDIVDLMTAWWKEIEKWWSEYQYNSRRDQLSFYYCKWKLDTKMFMLKYPNYNIRFNNWFRWLPHNYESQPWSF